MRLKIDGVSVIDAWVLQTAQEGFYTTTRNLSAGNHTFVLEHYEHTGVSSIHLEWEVPGNSGNSEPITGDGDAPALPPAPISLIKNSCYASGGSVKLAWTGGEGSDIYHIRRRTPGSNTDFNTLIDTAYTPGPNKYQHIFSPNDAMLSYEYIVIGTNSSGVNRYSDTVVLPLPLLFNEITLSGTMTGTSVTLKWDSAITNPPNGRDDLNYITYTIKRRPKNSTTAWAQIAPFKTSKLISETFTVDSATAAYEYIVIASTSLSSQTKTTNTVLLPKPKVWNAGTPIGQYKDANGTTIYDGRMTSPVDQRVAGFQPAPAYVVPGSVVPCTVEVASDIDGWTKDVPSGGSSTTTGTEADTIQSADYIWSFTGGTSGDGFRARGSSGAVSATFSGREVDFVVSPNSPINATYNLTCTIANDHGIAVSSDDEGNRTDVDVVRTQQLKVSGSSSALKVYRLSAAATSTAPANYTEFGDTIGGEVYVALHIDLGVNDRVSSPKARVRIQELPDTVNGVSHTTNEDHVDVSVLLNDKDGWQEFYDPDGTGPKVLGWWSARKSPGSSTLSTENLKYRYLIKWETSEERSGDRYDVNQTQSGKVLGHNGNHKISISSVNNVIGAPIAFQTAGTSQSVASFAETVNVSNLTIANVSTSNGTSDYFKFDPLAASGSSLKNPVVSFKIQDEGDFTGHAYRWRVNARSTDIEDQTTSVVYEGISTTAGLINVAINQATLAADGKTQSAITGWGTYNFDISVREYASLADANTALSQSASQKKLIEGNKIDMSSLRSIELYIPYTMPSPNQSKKGHDGTMSYNSDLSNDLKLSYYLRDDDRTNQNTSTSLKIEMIPPTLESPIHTESSWSRNLNTPVLDRQLRHFNAGELAPNSMYITVITATDDHAPEYRDHKPHAMLAKNNRLFSESSRYDLHVWYDGTPDNTPGGVTSQLTATQRAAVESYITKIFDKVTLDFVNDNGDPTNPRAGMPDGLQVIWHNGTTGGDPIGYRFGISARGLSTAQQNTQGDSYQTVILSEPGTVQANLFNQDTVGVTCPYPGWPVPANGHKEQPILSAILVRTSVARPAPRALTTLEKSRIGYRSPISSSATVQYYANIVLHELIHALCGDRNNSNHCENSVTFCIKNSGSTPWYNSDMSQLNPIQAVDINGDEFPTRSPFHDRDEIYQILTNMKHDHY